jgi:hypothetical protein
MNVRYRLPDVLISKVSYMSEFANGGAQVTVRLKDGCEVPEVLVSNSSYIIAVRGYKQLPFRIEDIDDIFQSDTDKNPREHGGWDFWNDWQ